MICVAISGQGFRLAFFGLPFSLLKHFCAPFLEPMKSMFLSVLFLGIPFASIRVSRSSILQRYALLKCLARGALNGIDEMIETATVIKEEVREKRTSWKQYTLESGEFLRFGIQANTESYTLCKVRQKADHDASTSCQALLTAVKANRTLRCERARRIPGPLDGPTPFGTPSLSCPRVRRRAQQQRCTLRSRNT